MSAHLRPGLPGLASGRVGNDTTLRRCVRRSCEQHLHHVGRAIGGRVWGLCGAELGLHVVWSSERVADCSRCRLRFGHLAMTTKTTAQNGSKPARERAPSDREFRCMQVCLRMLAELDVNAAARVVNYLGARVMERVEASKATPGPSQP